MAKNKSKFVTGAVVALAVGVAATIFLNSKKGKKLQKNVKEGLGDFYKTVAPRLKKMKKIGQQEYKAFMKQAAQQYGKAKKMAGPKIAELAKEAQDSWNHFSKHLAK